MARSSVPRPGIPPGYRVESASAPAAEVLPRADVAAFVGLVAAGPASATVVESAGEFSGRFSEVAGSYLGPAVRAFFRNGGRRCWIVPVSAGDGQTLDASDFSDARLRGVGPEAMPARAATDPDGPPWAGVHALLDIDEVGLLAVPDAAWFEAPALPPDAPAPGPEPDAPAAPPPRPVGFGLCDVSMPAVVSAIAVESAAEGSPARAVAWTIEGSAAGAVVAELERSRRADFGRAEPIYRGRARRALVDPDGDRAWWYRVRAVVDSAASAWAVVRDDPTAPPEPPARPDPTTSAGRMLSVQASVCAARGDLLAVLAAPRGPTPPDTPPWAARLRSALAGAAGATRLAMLAAPWLLIRDGDSEPAAFPPDGALCGLLARRAIERGPWATIANLPLAGVLGLDPAPPGGGGTLVPRFEAGDTFDPPRDLARRATADRQTDGTNLVARTTSGYAFMNDSTLADEPELAPATTRRLLALLRRLAARIGPEFAFEPHGPALGRRVAARFEAILGRLLAAGALAGPDAASSFRVDVVDESSRGDDRLVVELRVAPALPLRFLTLRLVRTADRAFVVEAT